MADGTIPEGIVAEGIELFGGGGIPPPPPAPPPPATRPRAAPRSSTADDWSLNTANFVFTVEGVEIGRFAEVSGLSLELEVKTVEEGGQNEFVHQLPGRLKWPNLTLKRGVTKGDELFKWIQKGSGLGFIGKANKLSRTTAALSLLAPDGSKRRTWRFWDAFPVKWTGPTFAVETDAIATEELEIAHHGFTAA